MEPKFSPKTGFMEKIHEIIQENLYNDQFDTQQLAGKLGMSRSSLHRKLKQNSGYAASQVIRKIRLNKAMEMLKTSSENMTEVAFECGFHSLSYFTKCFREEFGYPPGKVRSDEKEDKKEPGLKVFGTENRLFRFPAHSNSFVGRKIDLQIIDQLLSDHRLITLVGPGGCGKTRLACELLATTKKKYQDGFWFADLAVLEKGELVSLKILETMQIPELPGMDPSDILKIKLREKQLIIVLDNCEHVLEACRVIADSLLSASHKLKIIATSRLRLNIPEEEVFQVSPLSLIDPETISQVKHAKQSDAVLLFEDRARMGDIRFELTEGNAREVATICHKVDGIPLGLEIVASRIKYMGPSIMLERLSERFSNLPSFDPEIEDRHKTLYATIQWGYDILSDNEKTLLTRLGIFPGSFDLEAVEGICTYEPITRNEVLDLLSNLLDRSMICTIRTNGESLRYNLLETIRQFASDLVSESDRLQLERNHELYYVSMAEKAYRERFEAQSFWMVRLELEHHNLLSALFRIETKNPSLYSSLVSFLVWFWSRSKHYMLARRIIEKIPIDENIPKDVLARTYTGYAKILVAYPGQQVRSINLLKKSADLWSELGRADEKAVTLADLAVGYYGNGDDNTGLRMAEEAHEIARSLEDKAIVLYCMLPLSQGYINLKKFTKARSVAEEVIKTGEELNHLYAQFVGHVNTADSALMQEKFTEAEMEYGRSIEICQSYGDFIYVCVSISGVAMAAAGQGRHAKALRLIGAVNKIAEETGLMSPEDIPMKFWQEQIEKNIRKTREQLGAKISKKYKDEGCVMSLEQAVKYALEFEKD